MRGRRGEEAGSQLERERREEKRKEEKRRVMSSLVILLCPMGGVV